MSQVWVTLFGGRGPGSFQKIPTRTCGRLGLSASGSCYYRRKVLSQSLKSAPNKKAASTETSKDERTWNPGLGFDYTTEDS